MINIISRSIVSTNTRGPRKVVSNLIQGLKELKYPFIINASLDATDTIWIHDDPEALIQAMNLPSHVAIIAGPNIYTLPNEIPTSVDTSRVIWIHPASWVQSFWQTFSTKKMQSVIWPTGIDTTQFTPNLTKEKEIILVYNKQRSTSDIDTVCKTLETYQEKYKVITYGKYEESEYQDLLEKSKAVVWVGRSESQGVGLLEALSTDTPALIWDVESFGDWTGNGHERFTAEQLAFRPVTAAPYFDDSCGKRFTDKTKLNFVLSEFLKNLPNFTPRKYVLENLSLTIQADSFLNIYKRHFSKDETMLKSNTITTKKMWRNDSIYFRLLTSCKDAIRRIMG